MLSCCKSLKTIFVKKLLNLWGRAINLPKILYNNIKRPKLWAFYLAI